MSCPTFHNLIDGQWLPAVSGKTILNLNPADHADVVGAFPSSDAGDVNLAVAAAKEAFAMWRLVSAPKRAEILLRAGLLLKNCKEPYAREMTREMGKVLAETRGDAQEAINEAFYAAGFTLYAGSVINAGSAIAQRLIDLSRKLNPDHISRRVGKGVLAVDNGLVCILRRVSNGNGKPCVCAGECIGHWDSGRQIPHRKSPA